MIWLIGLLLVLGTRVFLAGMNTKKYFYTEVQENYGSKRAWSKLNEDAVWVYCIFTAFLAVLWPIALPSYGLYLLGKKYAK